MAGERVTLILLKKSDMTPEEIAAMSDGEGWNWLYTHFPPKTHRQSKYRDKNAKEICFTGFKEDARKVLEQEAKEAHLEVVTSVTKTLRYLVTGSNAGPAKLAKAREQEVVILDVIQFRNMLETGELPY
jgi:NAD-dependent DNA ligase